MNTLAYLPNRLVRNQQQPFSLLEARIFLAALTCVHRKDKQLAPIRFLLQDVVDSVGGNTYRLLHDACAALVARTWDGESLFTTLAIAEQSGCIEGTFNTVFEQELLHGAGYTSVTVPASHFKNAYSYRLLWLLSSYQSLPHHTFSLAQLRAMLCGNQTVYQEYSDFKRYVLKPALKELNAAGYQVVFEEKKRGKKVTSLRLATQFPKPVKRIIPEFVKKALDAQVAAEPVDTTPAVVEQFTPEQVHLGERLINENNRMDLDHAKLIVKAVGRDSVKIKAVHSEIHKIVQLGIKQQGKRVDKVGEYLFTCLVKNLNLQLS